MFTPHKKVFTDWSLSPRRENQKTPVPNTNSSARISENGGAIAVRDGDDLEDLDGRTAKLENELLISWSGLMELLWSQLWIWLLLCVSTDCGTEGSCERSYDSSAREDNSSRSCNGVLDTGACNMQMNNVVPGIPMASVNPVGSSPANGVNSAAPGASRQDERELKREKRKQSNRESARRSRLRKQAEMEELGKKVDDLNVENLALRSEINKLVEDSEKLRSENSSLMDKLKIMQGQSDEMDSDRTENQETSHINTENLLSRVNNPVSNGVHELSEEK